jgi:cysteine-S-conjugate beta-lyase
VSYDFDRVVERRGSGSAKWEYYPEDVLPMWVADMDFPSPEPVVRALHARADHGFFGYAFRQEGLVEAVQARLERLYGWQVAAEEVVFIPSLVSGINLVCRAFAQPGDHVLNLTPAYPPFLDAPRHHGLVSDELALAPTVAGRTVRYELDMDAFAAAFHARTRIFMLSNPHNPIGVAYSPAQLQGMAEACLRHNTIICSDEIHADLLLGGTRHTPTATLSPEIAARTITLISPSKSFNLPGLGCGVAVVPNKELRTQLQQAGHGIVPHVNAMGLAAARAAFAECDGWLDELRAYLTANRDFYVSYVVEQMPQLRTTVPEATYLGWLDCRDSGLDDPYSFFLQDAKVALSGGKSFGAGSEQFVRINFGCPRALLEQGLDRMRAALERRG